MAPVAIMAMAMAMARTRLGKGSGVVWPKTTRATQNLVTGCALVIGLVGDRHSDR